MSRYHRLRPDSIIRTIEALQNRINAPFPCSGLSNVCVELLAVARCAQNRVAAAERPNIGLRMLIATILLCGVAGLAYVIPAIRNANASDDNLYGIMQGLEASMNIVVLVGATVLFLWTFEARRNRSRALKYLHELRSIIEVIDMHQLSKTANGNPKITTCPAPAERDLPLTEVSLYLQFSSEMLSLAAKIAALYAQGVKDTQVLETTSNLQQLAANLSNTTWQKIEVVERKIADNRPGQPIPGTPA